MTAEPIVRLDALYRPTPADCKAVEKIQLTLNMLSAFKEDFRSMTSRCRQDEMAAAVFENNG